MTCPPSNEEVDGQLREMERLITAKKSEVEALRVKVESIERRRDELEHTKKVGYFYHVLTF